MLQLHRYSASSYYRHHCSCIVYFLWISKAPFAFLEKEPFDAEYGVTGMVSERKAAYFPTYVKGNIIGTCICILSPIPLLAGVFLENGFLLICLLCVTMFIAAIGASCFIVVGVQHASMQKTAQRRRISSRSKEK